MTTIALAQISLSNDIDENVARHLRLIESVDADLIAFPECSITGYDLVHLARNIGQLAQNVDDARAVLHSVCQNSGKMALIGLPYVADDEIFNGSLIVGGFDNEIILYRKRYLTDEEQDVFQPGDSAQIVNVKGKSFGILICRDQSYPELFADYSDVDCIVIQAAHYYAPKESLKKRLKNMAIPVVRAMDSGVIVAKVNAVGELGGKLSCGNSIIAGPSGNVLGLLGETEEGYLIHKL